MQKKALWKHPASYCSPSFTNMPLYCAIASQFNHTLLKSLLFLWVHWLEFLVVTTCHNIPSCVLHDSCYFKTNIQELRTHLNPLLIVHNLNPRSGKDRSSVKLEPHENFLKDSGLCWIFAHILTYFWIEFHSTVLSITDLPQVQGRHQPYVAEKWGWSC